MQIPRIILDCRVECGTCSDGSKCSNSPVIDKIKAQFIRLVILSGCNNCANIQRRPSSAIFKQQQMWNHRVYQRDALKKVWYLSQQSTSFSRSGDQQTRLICYWFGNTLSATKSLPRMTRLSGVRKGWRSTNWGRRNSLKMALFHLCVGSCVGT